MEVVTDHDCDEERNDPGDPVDNRLFGTPSSHESTACSTHRPPPEFSDVERARHCPQP